MTEPGVSGAGELSRSFDDAAAVAGVHLPWAWADYGQSDTIILINLPRGEHKVLIEVVDPEGGVLTSKTMTFQSPGNPGK